MKISLASFIDSSLRGVSRIGFYRIDYFGKKGIGFRCLWFGIYLIKE